MLLENRFTLTYRSNVIPFVTFWKLIRSHAVTPRWLDNTRSRPSKLYCLIGVPQGSILGPFIFKLYVSDLQNHIKCPCYQHAGDTTFFVHSKIKDLANGVMELNDAIPRLGEYLSESNLERMNPKRNGCLSLLARSLELARYRITIHS